MITRFAAIDVVLANQLDGFGEERNLRVTAIVVGVGSAQAVHARAKDNPT